MNTYRIEVDYTQYTPGIIDPREFTANFEIEATDRESAIVAMFDEMTDNGYQVTHFGNVYLLHEGVATLILPHQKACHV